jgi:C-terminal processing protease CtpA/Prc
VQNIDQDAALRAGLPSAKGALIAEIIAASPAAQAGLRNGDAILSINGNPVTDSGDLVNQIAGYAVGARIDVRIVREQRHQTLSIALGAPRTSAPPAEAGGSPQPSMAAPPLRVDVSGMQNLVDLVFSPNPSDQGGISISGMSQHYTIEVASDQQIQIVVDGMYNRIRIPRSLAVSVDQSGMGNVIERY